jgi:hypothetical protein
MAAKTNIITASDIDGALSVEFIKNFNGAFDRLAEIIGIFGVSTRAAGTALYQYAVSGSLNNSASGGTSSGTAYVEGEEVALSKYTVSKSPIGDLAPVPYRKMTTAKAIIQDGYEKSVMATDNKMIAQIRAQLIKQFLDLLGNGTGTPAQGATVDTLQKALAYGDAALDNAMETNGDRADSPYVHFIHRNDAADYLAGANITVQTLFGMTYLENFLGVERVFLTNQITPGTVYVTPAENIHAYGIDFSELSRSGLVYYTDSNGLIGVAHKGAYDYASAETDVMTGLQLIPEVLDYIVKSQFAGGGTTTTTTTIGA